MPDIEEQIRQAISEGKFSELSGKGKPLQLDENPLASPEWRLAYHLLQTSGYPLPWIERRRDILQELEGACHELSRSWTWHNSEVVRGSPAVSIEMEWRQAVAKFDTQVERLNRLIRDYNLQAPLVNFHLPLIHSSREIERLTAAPLSDRL